MTDTAVNLQNAANETKLEYSDNRLLADLCGAYDRNLATIEKQLDLKIVHRGNQLILMGAPDVLASACDVLNNLYTRLEQGRTVELADVEAEVRMSKSPDGGLRKSPQLEMFRGGAVEIKTRKKIVEPRTDAQKAYVKALFDKELAFGIGPAGTGKTYLAVAVGVAMYITGQVDKIILSRPAVEAGERLGFLPGDMKEKVDPYMQPLYDALNDFLPAKQMEKLIEDKKIEIAPLAFMR
ncbi:MAG: PhoH family protein, partial [Planktomarina sp.]